MHFIKSFKIEQFEQYVFLEVEYFVGVKYGIVLLGVLFQGIQPLG